MVGTDPNRAPAMSRPSYAVPAWLVTAASAGFLAGMAAVMLFGNGSAEPPATSRPDGLWTWQEPTPAGARWCTAIIGSRASGIDCDWESRP